jgi:hypothetical protein
MSADLNLLRRREEMLTARIESTQDPFLRDNLVGDLQQVVARISALMEAAA